MKDEERVYWSDDWYPRFNLKVEQKRLDKLVKLGFIQEASTKEKDAFPKHTGGGWYELSNGERVQGKEEAQKKQKSLDK